MSVVYHFVYSILYEKAVLIDDTALFILFGKTTAKLTTNNVAVLDVRNVSAIKFSDQFPLEGEPTAFAARNDASNDNGSSGLSPGTMAGIIVGIVAAVSSADHSSYTFLLTSNAPRRSLYWVLPFCFIEKRNGQQKNSRKRLMWIGIKSNINFMKYLQQKENPW